MNIVHLLSFTCFGLATVFDPNFLTFDLTVEVAGRLSRDAHALVPGHRPPERQFL